MQVRIKFFLQGRIKLESASLLLSSSQHLPFYLFDHSQPKTPSNIRGKEIHCLITLESQRSVPPEIFVRPSTRLLCVCQRSRPKYINKNKQRWSFLLMIQKVLHLQYATAYKHDPRHTQFIQKKKSSTKIEMFITINTRINH